MKIPPSASRPHTLWLCLLLFFLDGHAVHARDSVEKSGDALAIVIPALGLGSTLFYEEGYEGTLQFLESFATAQLTTMVLKNVTNEKRPNGACCKSFPSGHASAAFMGAGFIHERYGLKYAMPAYVGATYVGYTRVHADKHFVKDVVAGAAIGVLSSFYFSEPYRDISVTPSAGNGAYGIHIGMRW